MEIRMLSAGEISRELFADFIRRQQVGDCRRRENGTWVIRNEPSVDDWNEKDYAAIIRRLKNTCATGGLVLGVFIGDNLKGFASVEGMPFGPHGEYMDLTAMHVSADCREQGLGAVLFRRAANWAAGQGAGKLYISAPGAVETQAFYHAMGCRDAKYESPQHVQNEPLNVQMEFELVNCHKSKERALEVLEHHLTVIEKYCRGLICSVILVGSLSDGSYSGNSGSDIDLIHVLREDAPDNSREKVLEAIARTEEETENEIPLARCIYRYQDLFRPYPLQFSLCVENRDYIELPIEILRIKDGGRTVYGEDIREKIDRPRKEDVVASKQLSQKWAKRERAAAGVTAIEPSQLPLRMKVQSVLMRALLDYYFVTGRSCSSKNAIAADMLREVPGYRFQSLLERCTRWRCAPESFTPEDEAAVHADYEDWLVAWKDREIDFVPRN